MARNDLTVFEALGDDVAQGKHDFETDVFRLGLIDNTTPPTAADVSPSWNDYSANEVGTGGGYTAGGIAVPLSVARVAEVTTIDDDSGDITIAENESGFDDAYWGILYNDTHADKPAVAFVDLGGPVSEQAGPVNIMWSALGILTATVQNS